MNDELQNHIQQLLKIQSTDNDVRMEGESYIAHLRTNNPFDIFRLSCSILLLDEIPIIVIKLSYILINQNSIFLMNNWSKLNIEQQNTLRSATMRGLFYPDQAIRNLSSYSFCLVIQCGIDAFQQDILSSLAIPICNPKYPTCCTIGCFMALKELIAHNIFDGFNNVQDIPYYTETGRTIINAFGQIMSNPKVFDVPDFIEFLKCYSIILPFFRPFYNNQESRESFFNLLMNVFTFLDSNIHSSLYNLLFCFFKCFYEDIDKCMYSIFEITKNSLCMADNPEIIYPAVIFWQEIAEYEISIMQKYESSSNRASICYKRIIMLSAKNLVNIMMNIITKFAPIKLEQSTELQETVDLNSLCLYRDAADCLRLFSALTNDVFTALSSQFDEHKNSADWQDRFAAVYSLWCISNTEMHNIDVNVSEEFRDRIRWTLNNFYESKFNDIINLTKDPNQVVQISAFSILSVIFRLSYYIVMGYPFMKKISTLFNIHMNGLKRRLIITGENQEPFTDLIPSKICDIIHEIGSQVIKGKINSECIEAPARSNQPNNSNANDDEDKDIFKIVGCINARTPFSTYFFKFLRNLFNIFVFPAFQTKEFLLLQNKCTEAIAVTFSATPGEQVPYVLQSYLPIICSFMESNITLFASSKEDFANNNIGAPIRLVQLCIILTSIIEGCGTAIIEYSEPIFKNVRACLTLKHIPIHEEALLTLCQIVKYIGPRIVSFIEDLLAIFFISQDAHCDLIIERSTSLILLIFEKLESHAIIDPNRKKDIFDIFVKNLKNNDIHIRIRLLIINVFGKIIRIMAIAAEPFLPLFYEVLIHYQQIQFNLLLNDDAIAAPFLYSTVLNGYANLIMASNGCPFIQEITANFDKIIHFLDIIKKNQQCLTFDVERSILNFVSAVLNNFDDMRRFDNKKKLMGLIHGRVIKQIFNIIRKDQEIYNNKETNVQLTDINNRLFNT